LGSNSATRRLISSWWVVFPATAIVVARLIGVRACGDAYNLLPSLTADPGWAWALAAVYVAGHVWFLCAYLVTSDASEAIAPGLRAIRTVWETHTWKLLLMTALLSLEYAPVGIARLIGTAIGCR
jgi:hypothetical protein